MSFLISLTLNHQLIFDHRWRSWWNGWQESKIKRSAGWEENGSTRQECCVTVEGSPWQPWLILQPANSLKRDKCIYKDCHTLNLSHFCCGFDQIHLQNVVFIMCMLKKINSKDTKNPGIELLCFHKLFNSIANSKFTLLGIDSYHNSLFPLKFWN